VTSGRMFICFPQLGRDFEGIWNGLHVYSNVQKTILPF
jgi:hypothetical protein